MPPVVAYFLDMIHLGSNYNSDASHDSEELKLDVDEVPIGMCAWGDRVGKLSADECMQVLAEYEDEADDEEDVPETESDAQTEVHTTRFIKNIRDKVKRAGEAIRKGAKGAVKGVKRTGNKIVNGVKHTVRRVSEVCKRNPSMCRKVAQYGIHIIRGKHPYPPYPPYPRYPPHRPYPPFIPRPIGWPHIRRNSVYGYRHN